MVAKLWAFLKRAFTFRRPRTQSAVATYPERLSPYVESLKALKGKKQAEAAKGYLRTAETRGRVPEGKWKADSDGLLTKALGLGWKFSKQKRATRDYLVTMRNELLKGDSGKVLAKNDAGMLEEQAKGPGGREKETLQRVQHAWVGEKDAWDNETGKAAVSPLSKLDSDIQRYIAELYGSGGAITHIVKRGEFIDIHWTDPHGNAKKKELFLNSAKTDPSALTAGEFTAREFAKLVPQSAGSATVMAEDLGLHDLPSQLAAYAEKKHGVKLFNVPADSYEPTPKSIRLRILKLLKATP